MVGPRTTGLSTSGLSTDERSAAPPVELVGVGLFQDSFLYVGGVLADRSVRVLQAASRAIPSPRSFHMPE